MDLKLYDTLTREKRVFCPARSLTRAHVCLRADGLRLRPYRQCAAGHRVRRAVPPAPPPLRAGRVTYVRNITDVDDKINARAAERGIDIRELTEGTYANFREDVAALGCLPPTVEPRATEHIAEMRTIIERLVASGNAYVAEEHVLFSVPSMPDYGKLSKRSLDEMEAGARVDVAPYKRGDMDFVLWKPSKPGEPGWPSARRHHTPGRPGWHIECSAMCVEASRRDSSTSTAAASTSCFRTTRTRSRSRDAPSARPVMANYWMHNGFLQDGRREDVEVARQLHHHPRGARRLAGRRDPSSNAFNALSPADQLDGEGARRMPRRRCNFFDAASADAEPRPAPAVLEALVDDLNTPKAIAEMHALRNAAGRKALAGTLAFFGFRPEGFAEWRAARAPAPALPVRRSIGASPRGFRRARPRTSRKPIASATNSPRSASC